MASRPDSRLFHGRMFFLGGSSDLERPAPGVLQGDLSGIRLEGVQRAAPALHLPAPRTGARTRLGPQARAARRAELRRADHARRRGAELAARPVPAAPRAERQVDPGRGLAEPRGRGSRRSQVRPLPRGVRRPCSAAAQIRLQETYPCSEGFIAFGDPATGLLRLVFDHGLFYEFVPRRRARFAPADAALAGRRPDRRQLRDRRLDLRGHVGPIDRRHGPVRVARSPLAQFHRPDQVLALRIRRASDQRGGRGRDRRRLGGTAGRRCATGTSGRCSRDAGASPLRRRVPQVPPADVRAFRTALDADLLSRRNADYRAHRAEGVGLPLPAFVVASPVDSKPGCDAAANWEGRTRCRAWTTPGRSPAISSVSVVNGLLSRNSTLAPDDRRGLAPSLSRSGRMLLFCDQPAIWPTESRCSTPASWASTVTPK